jgi:nucleoid-associated protein YgaU
MRTEVKFAVVVVLVVVIAAAMYFLRREGDKPIPMVPARPSAQTVTPKVEELPLGRGPAPGTVTERTEPEESPASRPSGVTVKETPRVAERGRPLVKIDLNETASQPAPTPHPGRAGARGRLGRVARTGSTADRVFTNQPAKIDLENTEDNATKPLSAAEPTTATVHVVKPDETLYQIARQYYGRAEMWTIISRANQELHPSKLRVGQKLTIPAVAEAKTRFDGPAESAPGGAGKGKAYKVQSGDSLQSIAREHLGSAGRWKEIYELNKGRIGKPESLKVGQTIYLPEKAAKTAKAAKVAKTQKAAKPARKAAKAAKPTPVEKPPAEKAPSDQ